MEEEIGAGSNDRSTSGATETEIGKGCLVDFKSLEIGDILFHVTRGRVEVTSLLSPNESIFPIGFKYLESDDKQGGEDYSGGHHDETQDSCSPTGKLYKDDRYPAIYARDPFEYTLKLLKEAKNRLDSEAYNYQASGKRFIID